MTRMGDAVPGGEGGGGLGIEIHDADELALRRGEQSLGDGAAVGDAAGAEDAPANGHGSASGLGGTVGLLGQARPPGRWRPGVPLRRWV